MHPSPCIAAEPCSLCLSAHGWQVETGGKGVVALCGPVARGALVAATSDGHFSLCDSRAGEGAASLASAPALAHAGGFAAVDGRGNFVATAGYTTRMGRLLLENHIKVATLCCLKLLLATFSLLKELKLLRLPSMRSSVQTQARRVIWLGSHPGGMGGVWCVPGLRALWGCGSKILRA